ncbi:UNVERIFIED_CONTAM: hypothetical protein FKN15_032931 [Acipenser sinensis]
MKHRPDTCEYGENCVTMGVPCWHGSSRCRYAHSEVEMSVWKAEVEGELNRSDLLMHSRKKETPVPPAPQVQLYCKACLLEYRTCCSEVLIMSQQIEGVSITCDKELMVQCEERQAQLKWSFKVQSERPLVHVALLKQEPGATFTLTQDGSPKVRSYAEGNRFSTSDRTFLIEIFFESVNSGIYEQWVVFDFDMRPVLVQKIQVRVGQQNFVQPDMCLDGKESGFADLERWNSGNRIIVPCFEKTEAEQQLLKKYKAPVLTLQYKQRTGEKTPITQMNYKEQMHSFLNREEQAEEEVLSKLSQKVTISTTDVLVDPLSGMKIAPPGDLFAKVPVAYALTPDTNEGYLLKKAVQLALLAPNPQVNNKRPLVHVALLKQEPGATFTLTQDGSPKVRSYAEGNRFSTSDRTFLIEIFFESVNSGIYEQWVVFDFDMRPVLVQKIQVRVGQQNFVQPDMCLDGKESGFADLERWNSGNRIIVPCFEKTEAEQQLLKKYKAPVLTLQYKHRTGEKTPITQMNYKEQMHSFLNREEQAEEEVLSKLSQKVTISTTDVLVDPLSGMKIAPPGDLFAKVPVAYALTPDTNEGYLLKKAVQLALLAPNPQVNNKVYETTILRDANTEKNIYLQLSKRCCSDLDFQNDKEYDVEVQFQMERLRSFCTWHLAVDLLPEVKIVLPDFAACSVPVSGGTFPKGNAKQQTAISFIVGDRTGPVAPLLIYGPFGTGKTCTLANAAMETVRQPGTRVLICTHTNSAADLYVKEHLHHYVSSGHPEAVPLRIKSETLPLNSTDAITLQYCHLSEDQRSFTFPDRATLDSHRIIITTTETAKHFHDLNLPRGYFTHILIDEASQMLECAAIMPLSLATSTTRVVLAGDHMQMSPKLFSVGGSQGSDYTLLNRLFHFYQKQKHEVAKKSRIIFNENYRSTKGIIDFVSTHFYIKGDTIKASGNVPPHPRFHPLMFYHVHGTCTPDPSTMSWFNVEEINQVAETVQGLLKDWPTEWGNPEQRTICVVSDGAQTEAEQQLLKKYKAPVLTLQYKHRTGEKTPITQMNYKEQMHSFLNREEQAEEEVLSKLSQKVTISTTDVLDGPLSGMKIAPPGDLFAKTRESLLTSNSDNLEFFNEAQVLNTAMTRAQSQVIVVGDAAGLCYFGNCSKIWKSYIKQCVNEGTAYPEYLTMDSIDRAVVEFTKFMKTEEEEAHFWTYCHLSEDRHSFTFPDRAMLDSHRIIITTTMMAKHFHDLKLPRGYFTHILIDEASQMLECAAIMPLSLATSTTRVVLAGDHMQMSPKLFSVGGSQCSDYTLLNRLFHFYQKQKHEVAKKSRIIFNENYRSTKGIIDFVSTHFYIKGDTIKASGNVPPHPRFHPLMFYHVHGTCTPYPSKMSWFNIEEINQVAETVQGLLKDWPTEWGNPEQRTICVVSDGAQVILIRNELRTRNLGKVTVENLANIQGKQFRVIVITTVQTRESLLTSNSDNLEFFNEAQVLNTAMTRAQSQVIVVGDAAGLCYFGNCSKIWKSYIKQCVNEGTAYPEYLTMDSIDRAVVEFTKFMKTEEEDDSDTESFTSEFNDNIDDPILQELLDETKNMTVTVTDEGLLDIFHNNENDRSSQEQDFYQEQDSPKQREDLYTDFPEPTLNLYLQMQPNIYKLCELVLEKFDSGYGRPFNEPMMQIRIKGRKNIGMSFPGDHVVVQIYKSPENESAAPSGKVVGVLKKADSPRVFVCTIDSYDRQVMTPMNNCVTKIYTPCCKNNRHSLPILSEFRRLLGKSYTIRSNSSPQSNVGHYSLQLESYTWASSPIRRYLDIIVQRQLHAALYQTTVQYSIQEMDLLCMEFTQKSGKGSAYEKKAHMLSLASKLKKQGMQKLAFVLIVQPKGNGFRVSFPFNKHTLPDSHFINYRHLQLVDQPLFDEEMKCMILKWRRRVYSMETSKTNIELRGPQCNPFTTPVQIDTWQQIVAALREEDWDRVTEIFSNMFPVESSSDQTAKLMMARKPIQKNVSQTVESSSTQKKAWKSTDGRSGNFFKGKTNFDHYVNLTLNLKPGDTLQVQMTTDINRGLLVPAVQLLNIHPKFEVCLDHAKNPVICFSKYAVRASKKRYTNVQEYQKTWKPLCEMESASSAVAENDSIIIEDMSLTWIKEKGGKKNGTFDLPVEYKKEWSIECDLSKCFLCIRCRGMKQSWKTEDLKGAPYCSEHVDPNNFTWVAHGITTDKLDQSKLKNPPPIKVQFYINHMSMENTPVCVFQADTQFTVELIPKLLPDATFIIQGLGLPQMNESQNNAIRQALKNSFTLIQGPPGTGKTVVGVHIVYWFHKMNLEASNAKKTRVTNEAEETKKTCILYCGPSNKSVDVVAEYLLRFTETLRPLRVYSEQMEMIEFPYPGSILQLSRKSIREGKPKAELRSITLHHRIRMSENPFSTQILSFDARIRREEDLTDEEVEQYKHTLSKARQYELAKHDVILCTCTAAASPSLKLNVNPREILIDECAMATEPEALIPLVSYKPEKIVLLGDHKQLRPIVQNELLRKLGMEKSLFERYMDQAVMLDTQYRMHEEICAFPSMEFYKGRLKTDVIRPTSVLHAEWKRCTPILFGHVVGEEVSLVVSSEKGNENSKANLEEAEMAVRVAKLLINVSKVRPETIAILTPYNAQVSEIQKLLLKSEIQNVTVSTIMKSQGSEWRYVILSTVRSLPCSEIETEPTKSWIMKNLGFVTDPNQVNVGITRAQEGLCIIGNRNLLHCSSLWKKLLKHYTAKNCIVNAKDITVQKPRAR